jgi:hypothetical protein
LFGQSKQSLRASYFLCHFDSPPPVQLFALGSFGGQELFWKAVRTDRLRAFYQGLGGLATQAALHWLVTASAGQPLGIEEAAFLRLADESLATIARVLADVVRFGSFPFGENFTAPVRSFSAVADLVLSDSLTEPPGGVNTRDKSQRIFAFCPCSCFISCQAFGRMPRKCDGSHNSFSSNLFLREIIQRAQEQSD